MITDYHTWGRYKLSGYLNESLLTFDSIKPNKEQKEFTLKSVTDIDETQRMRTDLGDGIVKELKYWLKNRSYDIKLEYDNQDAIVLTGTPS